MVTNEPLGQAPFQAHVELLRLFLTHREDIAERLESVLNAQRKPVRNPSLLSHDVDECFTSCSAGVRQTRLELEDAHWARGFRPRQVQHLHNDLIDSAEMILRASYCWQQTRWPGRSGRMHYAQTLFNLYVIRWLQFLSMRLWDEAPGGAGERLAEIQSVLDELWRSSPAGQPALVRDARWLIPLAQSLITDELAPYFEIAQMVADTLPEADALEIHKAHVRMLGGHLTSQIRYYSTKDGVPIDDHNVVLRTRTSNALDFALLVQGLVALLKAHDRALQRGDERLRLDMAGAICQGISPDPELFLNRLDLLSAYTMIENVFIVPGSEVEHAAYSPQGQRHVQLLKEYCALMDRLVHPLREDFQRFRPVAGGCSPYGVLHGLPSNLIENMALKALQHDAETRFSLEDIFDESDTGAAKLAWVNGWRQLPHIAREVQRQYDYPQQFAEDVYGRIEGALKRRASSDGSRTGRLYIDSQASAIPELPARYRVEVDKAEPDELAQLLAARQEGHFIVSYETPGGWIAFRKELLTEILGTSRDARIVGLPSDARQVLRLMCTGLTIQ